MATCVKSSPKLTAIGVSIFTLTATAAFVSGLNTDRAAHATVFAWTHLDSTALNQTAMQRNESARGLWSQTDVESQSCHFLVE